MATQEDIDAVSAQLDKAFVEDSGKVADLNASIADLEAQLAALPVPVELDLSAVKAVAEALDDIVPDVPAEVPVEDVPVTE